MAFTYEILSTGHVEMLRVDAQGNRSRRAVEPHDQAGMAAFAGADLDAAMQTRVDAAWATISVPVPFNPPADTPVEAIRRDFAGSIAVRALIRALNRPANDPLAFVPGQGLTQQQIVDILIANK